MFDAKHEINKMASFCSVQVFLFSEMRKVNFCQKFVKFHKVSPERRRSRPTKLWHLKSYFYQQISQVKIVTDLYKTLLFKYSLEIMNIEHVYSLRELRLVPQKTFNKGK